MSNTIQPVETLTGAGGIEVFKNTEFGEIRTTAIDGEPWFIGRDVAAALGYTNSRKALADHVDDEDKGVTKRDTLGGRQDMVIINESGLYSLVLSSKLPTARKFKRWITSEVIPSIRRHGAYLMPSVLEQAIQNPDFIIGLVTNIKEERQKRLEAQSQVVALTAKVSQMKPKADYCDLILATTNAVTITQIAADYNMSARALNQKLHEIGIQHKVNDQWILYVEYMDKGYTRSSTFTFEQSNGKERTKMSTLWTQKGRLFLYEELKKHGIVPLMELETTNA